MKKAKKLFVILGNQLFHPKYLSVYKDHTFFLSEDYKLCTYEKHHKLKILFFLSSMRSFRDELRNLGFEVLYKDINDNFKIDYAEKIKRSINDLNIEEVSLFEIEEKKFESKLLTALESYGVKINIIKSPMFLNTREEFKEHLSTQKKPFMASFYKYTRKRLGILIEDNGNPKGGKWSYDEDNRKKLPKDIIVPDFPKYQITSHTKELKNEIETKFSKHPGELENFWLPTTRKQAFFLLDEFLNNKLQLFGDYEDAVSNKSNTLFHSALSPLLNIGLITPSEILQKLLPLENKIPINSFEGYVRQLIGWREFIRGIYQNYNIKLEKSNFFNHKRSLRPSWYSATTGLEPLDFAIKNASENGWSHHIERLMILANIMNLCEIEPVKVYKWFMEMFVDSADWVMSPNVYGMGLFSDGGIFATKPYICGSSYFLKMMHFKKGEWCDIMDGLYWRFINKNKNFFSKNPRLSMMVRVLEKLDKDRKSKIFEAAERFIKKNTC